MKVRMELISDTIFGSGISVPGAEDIAVLFDRNGFPYLKGSTLRGILREEAENYAVWTGKSREWLDSRFGMGGIPLGSGEHFITVTDFELPYEIRKLVLEENVRVESIFTSERTFTKIENGMVEEGSLRTARCINKGLVFYGEVLCNENDQKEIKEILSFIHWIGTMRTRGFGEVVLSVVEQREGDC